MNNVCLIGRLTKDPEGENCARYTLAVDKNEGTDFISCVAFSGAADFAKKYLKKGMKVGVSGRLTTGSYEKNGQKVYTTDVIVNQHTFCERKAETPEAPIEAEIPEDLPFK